MKKRKEIMQECPEEFADTLSDYIDTIEVEVIDAKDSLKRLKDLAPDAENAYDVLDQLASDLY